MCTHRHTRRRFGVQLIGIANGTAVGYAADEFEAVLYRSGCVCEWGEVVGIAVVLEEGIEVVGVDRAVTVAVLVLGVDAIDG